MDALRLYEERGYTGQFAPRDEGAIKCFTCGVWNPPHSVQMDSMRRIEGVSDPADMVLVGALRCPNCGVRGTATFNYGPTAGPEDAAALRRIEDVRTCLHGSGVLDRADFAP